MKSMKQAGKTVRATCLTEICRKTVSFRKFGKSECIALASSKSIQFDPQIHCQSRPAHPPTSLHGFKFSACLNGEVSRSCAALGVLAPSYSHFWFSAQHGRCSGWKPSVAGRPPRDQAAFDALLRSVGTPWVTGER
jgi:hypothetical protein